MIAWMEIGDGSEAALARQVPGVVSFRGGSSLGSFSTSRGAL